MSRQSHLMLSAIAALAGCVLYYAMPGEYLAGIGAIPALMLAVMAGLVAVLLRRSRIAASMSLILAIVMITVSHAEFRSRASLPERAPDWPERAITISGWIETIGPVSRGRPRLTLRLADPELCPAIACRVRILADPGSARQGDAIELRAVLQAPRRAAVPGAYDFAFNAYHGGLIGTGYAVTPAQVQALDPPDSFARRLAAVRGNLADRVRAQLPGRNGALAAALLTGDRSGLDMHTQTVLRASGLGHILAISGLHMALFAGSVFLALRSLLAVSPARIDPARPAAVGAMLAALAYFLISGGSIPTQRALLMALIALGAVLLRRRALSMHTLAIALLAVILVQPHSVVTAGFQMSFAAAAALVAVFAAVRRRQASQVGPAPHPVLAGLGGLSLTSLVAGGATGIVSAFHFHRIASFGFLANLLAMPVFTFIVMPAGLASFLLLPLGLEGLALHVMGWGLDLVMAVAGFVTGWPAALRPVAAAPGWVFVFYAAGFVALVCAGQGHMRGLAAGVCGLALVIWAGLPRPDILVTERGIVIARFEPGDGASGLEAGPPPWASSSARRDRFAQAVFLERQGHTAPVRRGRVLSCDAVGCAGSVDGLVLAVLAQGEDWRTDCDRADLIVLMDIVPRWVERACDAVLITARDLRAHGAVQIWLHGGRPVRWQWVQAPGRSRRWHPGWRPDAAELSSIR